MPDPMEGSDESFRDASWAARSVVLAAIALSGVGVWAAFSFATGKEKSVPEPSAQELVAHGRALIDRGRNRKAVLALKRALNTAPGDTPTRVRASANYALGIALRRSGRFDAAEKPLRRSRRLGVSPAEVGAELAKARAGIGG